MEQKEIRALLDGVASGTIAVDDALLKLKEAPFEDLGFAKLDHHRSLRQGMAEVIYGASKTPVQILEIARAMQSHGQHTILITRMSKQAAELVEQHLPLHYDPMSRLGVAPIRHQEMLCSAKKSRNFKAFSLFHISWDTAV